MFSSRFIYFQVGSNFRLVQIDYWGSCVASSSSSTSHKTTWGGVHPPLESVGEVGIIRKTTHLADLRNRIARPGIEHGNDFAQTKHIKIVTCRQSGDFLHLPAQSCGMNGKERCHCFHIDLSLRHQHKDGFCHIAQELLIKLTRMQRLQMLLGGVESIHWQLF